MEKPLKKRSTPQSSICASGKHSPIIFQKYIDNNINTRCISPIDPWMKTKVIVPSESRITTTATTDGITGKETIRTTRSNQKEGARILDSSTCGNRLRKASLGFRENISYWTADRIDRISIMLFPSLFTIFNIIYWSYYLSRSR